MTISEDMGIDQHLNQQLCFGGHLSLHPNRQVQSGQKYKMYHNLVFHCLTYISYDVQIYKSFLFDDQ